MSERAAPERRLHEAWYRGCSAILGIIGVTLALVLGLLLVSGAPFGAECWLLVAAPLAGAVGCRLRERLARS
jgi:hypothetical protein